MIIPCNFLVSLFIIGVSVQSTCGDGIPEIIPLGGDEMVGSPLLALKGLTKLKLLGGIKKIKLKLAGLGLKKGLLLGKMPLLGESNPFARAGEEDMDGTDSYYIGTPEDVGAHMWGSQQFDRNLHPENARYQMENNPNRAWVNHQDLHHAPIVGSKHEVEYLPGYFEPHQRAAPEFYRFDHEEPHPMHYGQQQHVYHPGQRDTFEFEGLQESQYKDTKVRSPNDDLYDEMEAAAHERERSDMAQSEYYKGTTEKRIKGVSNIPSPRFIQTVPQIVTQDSTPEQGQSRSYFAEPRQQVQYAHHLEDMKPEVLEWSSVKNVQNFQPQVVEWPSTANSEMVAAGNPATDNMSHLQREDENVSPVFLQEYIQAVKGTGHQHTAHMTENYYKKSVKEEMNEEKVLTENGNKFKEIKSGSHFQRDLGSEQQTQRKVSTQFQTTCNGQNCEQGIVAMKMAEKGNLDSVSRSVNEIRDDSKRSKLEVPNRRSIGETSSPRMTQQQTVEYANWDGNSFSEDMGRFAQGTQSVQTDQSFNQEFQRETPESYAHSMAFTNGEQNGAQQPIAPTKVPNLFPVRMVSQQEMENFNGARVEPNSELAMGYQTPFMLSNPVQSPAFNYGSQRPLYQQNSEMARLIKEEKPDIVMDNQPISAVMLPPDTRTLEMPEQISPRENYAIQYIPNQQSQAQYQQTNADTQPRRVIMNNVSDQTPVGSDYPGQYTPEQVPKQAFGVHYRTPQENQAPFAYNFDQVQYRGPIEGNQQYLPVPGNENAEFASEQQVGTMGPQVPEHGRTFHKKFLFGLKKDLKKGGYDYGGGYYHQNNYGGHGGYSQSYYGHSYGFVGQQSPSEASTSQEGTPTQNIQLAERSSANTDLVASESKNDNPDVVEGQESSCSCSRARPESAPEYHEDKRLYMANPEMVGTPFTTILSRPYLGLWGPNAFLGPLFRQPQLFADEPRFDDGPRDRFQRDNTLVEKVEKSLNLRPFKAPKPGLNTPGMKLKKALPRPLSSIRPEAPLVVKYVKADCDRGCNNDCDQGCSDTGSTTSKFDEENIAGSNVKI